MKINLLSFPPGMRLRILRTLAGMKLWQLATKSGVPQGRISEIETGRRSVTDEERILLMNALTPLLPKGRFDEAL